MAEPDELFSLRTYYWLGSYQSAINEANGLNRLKPHLVEEKDDYVYRAYIGLGQYDLVIGEISEGSKVTPSKRIIKLFAQYLANPNSRATVVEQVTNLLNDSVASANKTVQMVAATIFLYEDDTKECFRILRDGSNLEQYALLVQLYLRIFRVDLAQKTLKTMKSADEDSVLTMLSTAAIHLSTSKVQDAVYIYEELIDKYGASTTLLNSLAVAKMQLGAFEEAETSLQEALTKSPSDPDSLANIIIVSHHLGRTKEVINRLMNQLKAKSPNHAFLVSLNGFEEAFDRAANKLA